MRNELEILEKYDQQLQENVYDMMKDYKHQFETLTHTVESNNGDIERLRGELTHAQANYFELKSKQHVLESEVDS